jgi:leader peptidase (prepilin peptidase)/N-methyltransferase
MVVLGWAAGILVNYLADVLPVKRKLCLPVCAKCGETHSLTGYLFWPRACQLCGARRAPRVWVVEIFFIVATLWLWISPPVNLGFLSAFILLIYSAVVIIIDLEHKLILHMVSITGAILALTLGIWLHGLRSTLIGGAAGFGIMFVVYWMGMQGVRFINRRRGLKVDEEALGFGDVNLSGVLGLLLGWPGIVAGLILAIILGGIVSLIYLVIMVITGRFRMYTAIPYGPFLVLAAIALLFLRQTLLYWL